MDDLNPTLTDAERAAVASVLNRLCVQMTAEERQTLARLIERTTEK